MRRNMLIVTLLTSLMNINTNVRGEAAINDDIQNELTTPPELNWNPGPEYADSVRMFQAVPGIARAANGRLWVIFHGGGTAEGKYNYIMLVTSGNDGQTWSNLKLVIDPEGKEDSIRASTPALWLDPTDRLWLIWSQYPKGLMEPDSSLWAITTDNPDAENPTWSEPRLIAYPNINCFNKPTVLSDGTWLWPSGSWNKAVPSRPLLSSDEGKTFTLGGEILIPDKDREFDEYNVVELRDGRLWLLTRTKYGIGESFSTDKGKTWTAVKPSSIKHATARLFLMTLKSGNLLLVKHGPINQRIGRSHLTAYLSNDEGQTWSKGLLLDERRYVSYPDGVQAPDGTIYIVYDYKRHTDKEILMATFTEEDVTQGQRVTDKVRLQVLINKATGINPGKEAERERKLTEKKP